MLERVKLLSEIKFWDGLNSKGLFVCMFEVAVQGLENGCVWRDRSSSKEMIWVLEKLVSAPRFFQQ